MKQLLSAAAAAIVLAFSASASAAVVIDFEGGPNPLVYGGFHAGSSSVVDVGGNKVLKLADGVGPLLERQVSFFSGGIYPLPANDPSGFLRGRAVTEFASFDVFLPEGGQVTFNYGVWSIAPGTWTSIPMGPLAGDRIAKIRGVGALIDNIVVSSEFLSPVPEPATWAMMIVGFGLAGAGLRKSRAQRPGRCLLLLAS